MVAECGALNKWCAAERRVESKKEAKRTRKEKYLTMVVVNGDGDGGDGGSEVDESGKR